MEGTEQEGLQPEELTPKEKTRQAIERNKKELTFQIEVGVLDPHYFENNYLEYLQQEDLPLTRDDLGNQAVVITKEEFDKLGFLDMMLPDGEIMTFDSDDLDYEPDDPLIIFPEGLGSRENIKE
ncbi:MAG: hypothetical protein AAB785_03115 [Patescibacteria group bacterium]